MIKHLINKNLNKIGYHISKAPSIENKIKNGEYRWLQDFGIHTVIDVGANEGGFALLINKILPDAFIYSFEPIKSCFVELQKNTSGIKNIKHFNSALGDTEEEKQFYENEFSPSSSFLPVKNEHVKAFPFTANTKTGKIQVKQLDSFMNSFTLNKKILLKLDVQGYELNILKGSQKLLNEVDLIITEVSFAELYEGQPSFNEIHRFLYKHGFYYKGNFEQLYDPQSNEILQADAVFIKEQK
jgi:FkbM family methyltransferase